MGDNLIAVLRSGHEKRTYNILAVVRPPEPICVETGHFVKAPARPRRQCTCECGVASSQVHFFFNHPVVTSSDVFHSGYETRFYTLGKSDSGKHLFIVFTVRSNLIRIISARDMNRKERDAYKYHEENT